MAYIFFFDSTSLFKSVPVDLCTTYRCLTCWNNMFVSTDTIRVNYFGKLESFHNNIRGIFCCLLAFDNNL